MRADAPTGRLAWRTDDEFEIDGVAYACRPVDGVFQSTPERFCLRKGADLVRRIERMLSRMQPMTIVEVGVYQGGSTGLLAQTARPRKLVAIDIEHRRKALEGMIRANGLEDVVRPYWGVDQADGARLRQILDGELGGTPIDLVIDDASHLLEPTRATFNTLFPRVREGGTYVIEDWGWAHGELNTWPEVTPLSPLVFELVIAAAHRPEVIRKVEVDQEWTVVTKGDVTLASDFDVRTQLGRDGQRLLRGLVGGRDVG